MTFIDDWVLRPKPNVSDVVVNPRHYHFDVNREFVWRSLALRRNGGVLLRRQLVGVGAEVERVDVLCGGVVHRRVSSTPAHRREDIKY